MTSTSSIPYPSPKPNWKNSNRAQRQIRHSPISCTLSRMDGQQRNRMFQLELIPFGTTVMRSLTTTVVQLLMRSSISALIPGQKIISRARRLHLSTPRCEACTSFSMVVCMEAGMMTLLPLKRMPLLHLQAEQS